MLCGERHSCDTLISDTDLIESMQVIMIVRLYAMCQKSKKVLTFLLVTFLALSTINGTIAGMVTKNSSAGKHPLWMKNRCTALIDKP